jgi:hypothetical protein
MTPLEDGQIDPPVAGISPAVLGMLITAIGGFAAGVIVSICVAVSCRLF